MQNPDRVTVNCHAEMTHSKVRRSRATTSHHLQTGCHPQTTPTGVQSVATQPTGKDSHAQQKRYQCKVCHKFGHFTSQCFQKKQYHQQKYRQPKAHQIQVDKSYHYSHNYSSDVSLSEDSFCLQVKVQKQNKKTQKLPNTTHLFTNIAYRLKPHQTRNKYLRAQIDTGAEVNPYAG